MILKKPYAFLIKHFRLIHLILTLPLIYLVRKTHLVVSFFNQYVSNGYLYQTGSDISGNYINFYMYLSIFLIVISILAMYFLLKYKEKPVKMYVVMMIYYLALFAMLIWYSGIMSKMATEVLQAKAARMYRDISILIYLPQYIFITFTSLRAVGFNIKKFNFQLDMKELQIESEDNEEVEVGIEIDGYKTKRFFRRFKREFSYYLIENKLIISIIVITLIFSSILIYYKTRENYNLTYSQNNSFNHQGFNVNIKDSIISNLTYNGKLIDNEYYYLVLRTNVKNTYSTKQKLDFQNFEVIMGNKTLKPVLDRSSYFIDYANPYFGDEFAANEEKDIVLVYRLEKDEIKKSFKLRLLSEYDANNKKIKTKYAIVNLTPVTIDAVTELNTIEINNKLSLSNTNLGSTLLTITDFTKTNNYVYDYQICYEDGNCITKKDIASIDYTKGTGDYSLLVLGYDLDLDSATPYTKYIKNNLKFFEDFTQVRVKKGEEYEIYDVVNITPKKLTNNKVVLQVKGNILDKDDVDLLVTIRNKRYIINLS